MSRNAFPRLEREFNLIGAALDDAQARLAQYDAALDARCGGPAGRVLLLEAGMAVGAIEHAAAKFRELYALDHANSLHKRAETLSAAVRAANVEMATRTDLLQAAELVVASVRFARTGAEFDLDKCEALLSGAILKAKGEPA